MNYPLDFFLFLVATWTIRWAVVWRSRFRILEAAIKKHRAQRMDDRCWLDDYDLYAALNDGGEVDTRLPPKNWFLKNCDQYHDCRSRTETPEEAKAIYEAWKKSEANRERKK